MIPLDKQDHFLGGAFIASALSQISPVLGFAIACTAGIAKEIWDYCHKDKHTPDLMDFVATIIGGMCGALMYVVIDYIL